MSLPSSHQPRLATLSLNVPDPPPAPRAWTGALSIALHALVFVMVLVVPLLYDDRLPERADQVRAFFASPLELAPPPPPPPPPAASHVATRPSREAPVARFVAPVEVPTETIPEEGLDLGGEAGMPGGVEGGVPGGVVGGVVGGLPEAAPPPPPARPLRAGLDVREPRRVKDVPPVYPELAVASRIQGVVILECQIDVRGRIAEVRVLRGFTLLNDAAVEAVRQWVYTPTLVNGVPVPVIMTVTVSFHLTEAR